MSDVSNARSFNVFFIEAFFCVIDHIFMFFNLSPKPLATSVILSVTWLNSLTGLVEAFLILDTIVFAASSVLLLGFTISLPHKKNFDIHDLCSCSLPHTNAALLSHTFSVSFNILVIFLVLLAVHQNAHHKTHHNVVHTANSLGVANLHSVNSEDASVLAAQPNHHLITLAQNHHVGHHIHAVAAILGRFFPTVSPIINHPCFVWSHTNDSAAFCVVQATVQYDSQNNFLPA